MELPNGTVVRAQGHVTPIPKLGSVTPSLDEASAEKDPGCSWPTKKANYQRSQMVTAWRGNNDLARVQQMQEPQARGVSRSVLQRLLSMSSAPGSPIGSPRHRYSGASASIVAMVHSPRAFTNSDNSPAKTAPYRLAMEFGSYESSSNCSSQSSSPIPIGHFSDHLILSDDEEEESIDEVIMLRQQVALLVKSLEHEKKRRASEQHLMQKKIIELQSLIRGNGHDDALERDSMRKTPSSTQIGFPSEREKEPLEIDQIRRWSAPVYEGEEMEPSSSGCLEEASKPKLARLRDRMHSIVIDNRRETQTLRVQLESVKRSQNKREKELAFETTVKVAAFEQKHAAATTRLAQQAANSAALVKKLEAEKLELVACMQVQQERLKLLELALGEKQLVDDSR